MYVASGGIKEVTSTIGDIGGASLNIYLEKYRAEGQQEAAAELLKLQQTLAAKGAQAVPKPAAKTNYLPFVLLGGGALLLILLLRK